MGLLFRGPCNLHSIDWLRGLGDGARTGTTDNHLDVGLQADAFIPSENLGLVEQIELSQVFQRHSVLGVLPLDHVTEFNSRFNANANQNVLPDDSGTMQSRIGISFPFLFKTIHSVRSTQMDWVQISWTNSGPTWTLTFPFQSGPAPAEYVNYTFHDSLHLSGLVASALGPGELVHGIDSGMENRLARWSGLRLSQELPRPAPPPSTPPSAGTEPDQSIANENAVDPQPEDDDIAPRDINLAFDERNIVTGKRRRTQSSCVTDPNAADARPTKKRPSVTQRVSRSHKR
ncbi:hypothetical protein DFH09DRAFT_1076172 [Mycena vulgaris]|nr:hypothetical protein DFH09DRAFT_1076172 [Mycena vulgaris]